MLSSYEGRIGRTRHNIKCFYSRIFIFLFRMFLYVDVLQVVIPTVQLCAQTLFPWIINCKDRADSCKAGPLKICTLCAEGN